MASTYRFVTDAPEPVQQVFCTDGARISPLRGRPPARLAGAVAVGLLILGGSLAAGCVESPEQRRGSIYRWKAEPTEENVAKIRAHLADADRDVRATALNVLVSLRVPDSDRLTLEGIRDSDGFVRATACKLLGDLGDRGAAEVLAARLSEDRDSIVRQRAAEALTKLGGEVALHGLADGVNDPLDDVRLASVKGLRSLDPCFAKPALVRLLFEDSMWEIRVQAATALGACGDPEVLPALEAALEDPNEFVRSAAANAIRVHQGQSEAPGDGGDSN